MTGADRSLSVSQRGADDTAICLVVCDDSVALSCCRSMRCLAMVQTRCADRDEHQRGECAAAAAICDDAAVSANHPAAVAAASSRPLYSYASGCCGSSTCCVREACTLRAAGLLAVFEGRRGA